MKSIYLYIFLHFFLIIGFAQSSPSHDIIASIGKEKVILNDFEKRYSSYLNSSGIKDNLEVRKGILNNIINEIILKDFDNNENIYKNPEYQKEIAWAKKQCILGYLKDQQIYARLKVTENELKEAFFRLNQKVAARHIFTEDEETANFYYSLLNSGVTFENLASQVFTDSTLKNNGGFLGYFSWGEMDPAFEDAAFSLKIGEISKPVKTAQGYSIIRVDDRIQNPIMTETQYLQKKGQIERLLKIQKKNPAEKEYISNLVNVKDIKFNQEELEKFLNTNKFLDNKENNRTVSTNTIYAVYKELNIDGNYLTRILNELPKDFYEKLNSVEGLKAAITGFLIQDKLLESALKFNYDKNILVNESITRMSNNIFFKYKKQEILDKAEVSSEELVKFYKDNIHLFTKEPEINIQEIIVDNKSTADSLFLQLQSGKNFDECAAKFSIREWSAKNGGVMGFAPASRFGMLKEKFLNEDVGKLIEPIQIENIYGIFKVLGKTDEQPIEFNLIKDYAKSLLKEEKSREILNNYLEQLKTKITIKINNELLKSNFAG